jgi:protein SCO1/2
VLYFGFTHCPDVCPDELEKMSKVITRLDKLKGVGDMVKPIFISIDPQRDTPEVVQRYIKGTIFMNEHNHDHNAFVFIMNCFV